MCDVIKLPRPGGDAVPLKAYRIFDIYLSPMS